MKTKFIIGVVISIILIVCNQFFIQEALDMKKQDSRIINLMGRQRMLSQKIEIEFYKVAINKLKTDILVTYFNEWKVAHQKILSDSLEINKSLTIEKIPSKSQQWFYLSSKISFIEDQISRYVKTGLTDLDAVDENQQHFLIKMDKIVERYVDYSDKKLSYIIALEIILACFSILIIFLEVRYIYYPQARQLEDSLVAIKAKNKELSDFNYIASHDLKEPLRTVSNYTLILNEDFSEQLSEEAKKHLKTIEKATERMSALINSLLDFSRLGKDRKTLLIDCNILVRDVVGDLFSLIEINKAKVIINNLPEINAYQTELRQLFQNLISNAIKFKKKDTLPEIQIGYVNHNNMFEFYVKDNGIGIEHKHFERIFQMFQRLNNDRNVEGYGIGLANCKKIVEIHGGKLWVESEMGKGSTFKFTIRKNLL